MPNGCFPRSANHRLLPAGPTEEAVRPCASEVILEATLRELRDDLSHVDGMIRILEWADGGAEGRRSPAESAA